MYPSTESLVVVQTQSSTFRAPAPALVCMHDKCLFLNDISKYIIVPCLLIKSFSCCQVADQEAMEADQEAEEEAAMEAEQEAMEVDQEAALEVEVEVAMAAMEADQEAEVALAAVLAEAMVAAALLQEAPRLFPLNAIKHQLSLPPFLHCSFLISPSSSCPTHESLHKVCHFSTCTHPEQPQKPFPVGTFTW